MRISYTGSKAGMNPAQISNISVWLHDRKQLIDSASHGNCSGGDGQFHRLVRGILPRRVVVAVFPSTSNTRLPDPDDADYIADPKAPLDRNPDILEAGKDMLLAAPRTNQEVRRSGTWTSIRIARRRNMRRTIFLPNGEVVEEV